jgi:hypothetical protein
MQRLVSPCSHNLFPPVFLFQPFDDHPPHLPTQMICPAGQYSGGGTTSCTTCGAGKYSIVGSGSCSLCAAGRCVQVRAPPLPCNVGVCGDPNMCVNFACDRYGSSGAQTSDQCVGPCIAGYICPAGSSSSSPASCPAGQYSLAGASVCTQCPAGTYGMYPARSTASCSGGCNAGRYGATPGLTAATCTAPCAAGLYSLAGASVCTPCPVGRYVVQSEHPFLVQHEYRN